MYQRIKQFFANAKGTTAIAVGTAVATIAPSAIAQTAYDGLTTAVDWADVGAALLSVGVAIIGIMVVMKGIKLVVRMVKGA